MHRASVFPARGRGSRVDLPHGVFFPTTKEWLVSIGSELISVEVPQNPWYRIGGQPPSGINLISPLSMTSTAATDSRII